MVGLAAGGGAIDAGVVGELERRERGGARVLVDAQAAVGKDLGGEAIAVPVELPAAGLAVVGG